MRLHEITNTPGDNLLADFQIENVINELLQAVGNIRLGAVGCLRRQPAVLRVARPENSHFLKNPEYSHRG